MRGRDRQSDRKTDYYKSNFSFLNRTVGFVYRYTPNGWIDRQTNGQKSQKQGKGKKNHENLGFGTVRKTDANGSDLKLYL